MSITVNTNVASLMAQSNLGKAASAMQTSIERLSTGSKVNKAADDAAGMTIATNLNTQIRGSQVAQSNIQQGINVLQTTEGQLSGINDNLARIRDLATQAANGINSTDSKNAIISEVSQRVAEINKASKSSQFNGIKLLDGSNTLSTAGLRLQVGANSNAAENSITVTSTVFAKADSSSIGLLSGSFDTVAKAFANASTAAQFIGNVDTAMKNITSRRTTIGAFQNRLDSNNDSLGVTIENMSSSKSTVMDTDVAKESANFTKNQILQQASASLLAQANQAPSIALSLI